MHILDGVRRGFRAAFPLISLGGERGIMPPLNPWEGGTGITPVSRWDHFNLCRHALNHEQLRFLHEIINLALKNAYLGWGQEGFREAFPLISLGGSKGIMPP